MVNYVILKPLKQLSTAADKVAAGDLTARASLSSQDEMGRLGSTFNQMVDNVHEAMDQVKLESERAEEARKTATQQSEYLAHSAEVMLNSMERFADGDLTIRLDVASNDDIGRLFEGFNRAVDKISGIVNTVSTATESVASSAQELSGTATEIAAGSQESSSQAQQITEAVEDMSRLIKTNNQHAKDATDSSQQAAKQAEAGAEKMARTRSGMEQMVSTTRDAVEKMSALVGRISEINEIANVIDDIADQTNLLALNAAIEAARAGEQGRGFAVVAHEVRVLSEKTAEATQGIADQIRIIQSDSKEVDTAMAEVRNLAETSREMTLDVAQALDQILSDAKRVVEVACKVAEASEKGEESSQTVSANMQYMTSVAEETAAATQQIAGVAEELNNLTGVLKDAVGQFVLAAAIQMDHKKAA